MIYKDITPLMTSNNINSNGNIIKAFSDGEFSTDYQAFKAFDNNLNTRWAYSSTGIGSIGLDFGTIIEGISKIDIYKNDAQLKSFEIYYSIDNINYNLIYSGEYSDSSDNDLKECIFKTISARYIKIKVLSTFQYGPSIQEIKVYISNCKFLIKQTNKYYSIKSDFYQESDDTYISSIIDESSLNVDNFDDYGINDLSSIHSNALNKLIQDKYNIVMLK